MYVHYGNNEKYQQLDDMILWIIESFKNMYFTGDEALYRVNGSMFSGIRVTTLINTLLNKAYCDLV